MSELRRQEPVSRLPSRLGLAALITANLFIALHALNSGWGYHQALLIFWFEALIIGGYNVLRLLVVGLFGDQPFGAWLSRMMSVSLGSRILGTLIGTAFFVVKFGAFALSAGFWIVAMPAYFDAPGSRPADRVMEALSEAGAGLGIAVGVLVASHGVSFVWNFLWKREFVTRTVVGLVFWPYVRMALVLAVVIGGMFYVNLNPGLEAAPTMVTLFFLVKTIADAVTHVWEHRSFAPREATPRAAQAVTTASS